jgi:hypothetical protein
MLVLLQTEDDGLFLQCNHEGHLNILELEDDKFPSIQSVFYTDDVLQLTELEELFDPCLIKRNKHFLEMLPEFLRSEHILQLNVEDVDVNIYGIKVSVGVLKYKIKTKFKYDTANTTSSDGEHPETTIDNPEQTGDDIVGTSIEGTVGN